MLTGATIWTNQASGILSRGININAKSFLLSLDPTLKSLPGPWPQASRQRRPRACAAYVGKPWWIMTDRLSHTATD